MPNNAFRLGCGNKIVYIPQGGPKNLQDGRTIAAGLGIKDECCRCECKDKPCDFTCKFTDSFDGALDFNKYIPQSEFGYEGRFDWLTTGGVLAGQANNPNFMNTAQPNLAVWCLSKHDLAAEVTMGFNATWDTINGPSWSNFSWQLSAYGTEQTTFAAVSLYNLSQSGGEDVFVWECQGPSAGHYFQQRDAQPGFNYAVSVVKLRSDEQYDYLKVCTAQNGNLIAESEVQINSFYNYVIKFAGTALGYVPDIPTGVPLFTYEDFCISENPSEDFCSFCVNIPENLQVPFPDYLQVFGFYNQLHVDPFCSCYNFFAVDGIVVKREESSHCLWTSSGVWCDYGTNCLIEYVASLTLVEKGDGFDIEFTLEIIQSGAGCANQTYTAVYRPDPGLFLYCGIYDLNMGVISADDLTPVCVGGFPDTFRLNFATTGEGYNLLEMNANGPGTAVKSIFQSYGCDGQSYIHTMNNNGLDWCLQNVELIADWVVRSAKLKGQTADRAQVVERLTNILNNLQN